MKANLIFMLVGVATLVAAVDNLAETNEVSARWARVAPVAVHFMPAVDGQKWVNKKLSDVIRVGDIAKVVLLAAVTSAPPGINIFNIYKTLESDATFYQLNGKYPAITSTYRAIIVAKDNSVFQIEIGRAPDGKGIGRLTSEKGVYGYFR